MNVNFMLFACPIPECRLITALPISFNAAYPANRVPVCRGFEEVLYTRPEPEQTLYRKHDPVLTEFLAIYDLK